MRLQHSLAVLPKDGRQLRLIFGAKCLRHALTTLADMQGAPDQPRPSDDDQLRALPDQVEAMSASLRAIRATLCTGEPDSGDSLLQ